MQYMGERGTSLAIISEPYRIPAGNPQWVASADGSAAVMWRRTRLPLPFTEVEVGQGYAAVRWGEMMVVSVYLSPRLRIAEVEQRLDAMSRLIGTAGSTPILIAGDLNAHSVQWGCRSTNARGRLVSDWATTHGLQCLNRGRTSTCVRAQGESVVDTTWASPSAVRLVMGWKVVTDVETLSDHTYIEVELGVSRRLSSSAPKRWATKKLDEDLMVAALMIISWPKWEEEASLARRVTRFRRALSSACDVAMPRARARQRKATYWWSDEIADLRRESIAARRGWIRSRQRGRDPDVTEAKRVLYRERKMALGKAISRAKASSWGELLGSLNDDPWGLAYKIVRKKIRGWTLPITESLDPGLLGTVVDTLFPDPPAASQQTWYAAGGEPPCEEDTPWEDAWEVTEEETAWAIRRMSERNAAPGPDGIPSRAISWMNKVMGSRLRAILTQALKEGHFPKEWKRANMVLLRKEGKPEDRPSSYRPICLLSELGKILERVLARRMQLHLALAGPDLHPRQFGFRPKLSTVDAVQCVKEFSQGEMDQGRVVLAVALDVSNAFNSLPWSCIGPALERHRFPQYLRRILRDYLSDRTLGYRDRTGIWRVRSVRRGVPQGSVLGPLLWDLGYNRVLTDVALPPHCTTVCYADDTIVLAAGDDWDEARSRMGEALAGVLGVIRTLGLEVAPTKSEALFFHDGTSGNPPKMDILIEGVRVEIGQTIRYLGLTLDEGWNFIPHFERLAPRLEVVAIQCARLMPNLGGPGGKARRMYATAVNSVALYGAPIWAAEARNSRRILAVLRASLRRVAIRVVRGYRTVSFAGSTLLAGLAPLELQAEMRADVHERVRALRSNPDQEASSWKIAAIKIVAKRQMYARWKRWSADHTLSGARVREAIRPRFVEWVDRRWGHLSFRLTQVVTGHGCFGHFLNRIGREDTPACHHCASGSDTAQHTLADCPAWAQERRELVSVVGRGLDLPNLVSQMLDREEAWSAVARYCERVMLLKEQAERDRRGEVPGARRRQSGRGRGRGGRRGGG